MIDALVREGRHEEAAALLSDRGEAKRAAELYATVWKWSEAIETARAAGLYDEAYRHAAASGDREACARVVAELDAHPEQASRAIALAEARGRTLDAARLSESAFDLPRAGALYEKAGELGEAARVAEALGDARRAGMLYERRVREAPDDAESAFALGRILARFGRWDHAARALQQAQREPALEDAASRLLVSCFVSLGLDEAAAAVIERMRAKDPSLPRTASELLEHTFGDPRGVAGEQGRQLLLGRYREIRPLGAGGSGRVLLVEDTFYAREVALKVLHAQGSSGRDALHRFAREARVAASVDHPNVVDVLEYHPDGPYLVMELMAGGTLEDRLRPGEPLAPMIALHVGRSVLRGLEAVHRRGVVHRDLKPANVFFGPTGEVKIGDFGVAHLMDIGTTMTGAMMGSLATMAPEQITGASRPDATTDLYALGVILYRCLTGRLPFEGPDFVQQHLEEPVPAASDDAPWLSEAIDEYLRALLAKSQAERPRSASDALERLEKLPWAAAEERFVPGAPAPVRPSSSPPPPAESAIDARYQPLSELGGDTQLARDELLARQVIVVTLDAARGALLRALASADHPHLQAVHVIDEAAGRAVLEAPRAEPLGARALSVDAASQIERALAALHAKGLAHGAVDERHVLIGPTRAVLLLPSRESSTGMAADLDALSSLRERLREGSSSTG